MRPKSEIYTPKRDDEHPYHFHMRSTPPPLPLGPRPQEAREERPVDEVDRPVKFQTENVIFHTPFQICPSGRNYVIIS